MLNGAVMLLFAAWLAVLVIWVRDALAADACLDSGGSFDYIHTRCDTARNHPFVPFIVRHPYAIGIAGALTVLLPAIAGLRRGFRGSQRTG